MTNYETPISATVSAFAQAGPRYRENGVSVLPIIPAGKAPGAMSGKTWRPEHSWQRFCERLPTQIEMGFWDRWPNAGVGIALGRASAPPGYQLVAVDLDTDDADVTAAVYAVIPRSPVQKRGRKGHTGFYLASVSVENRPYNGEHKQRLLDLLCHGRQTVVPPTVHPNGGVYHWITDDTLEDFAVSDLPVLPDDVADLIGQALAPFGYVKPALLQGAQGDAHLSGDNIHRSLNDACLANLEAWVPALQLFGCYQSGGHYRAVAQWRASASGRPLSQRAANLSIAPEGIKDFGDADKGYTPIDLVMAAFGADLDTAFRWLQDRVAPATPLVLNLKRAAEPKDRPASSTDESEAYDPETGELRPAQETNVIPINSTIRANLAGLLVPTAPLRERPQPPAPVPAILPVEICQPAGLLGEVVEWMNRTASTPVPQHNLGAAIALLGTCMGRRWESPTRARTNFYIMALARSGFGKDHPMDAGRALMIGCGLDKLVAAEETKSDSAIRKVMERYPVAVMFMDEFGGWMRKILDRRAAAHDKRMRDLLLTFFSRANGDYMGAEGASERAVVIRNPHLCIYGASTPADMWKAFDSASGEDGLLARFLIFEAADKPPAWRDPQADVTEMPLHLRQRIQAMMNVKPIGNLSGVGNGAVKPIRAAWGEGAADWWRAYRTDNTTLAEEPGPRSTVYSRAAEHVLKLALVLAVGCDPQQPVIAVSALEWAKAVVECSMAAMFRAMEDRVADGDKQAEYLWVKRTIRSHGVIGIPMQEMKKSVNGRFDRRRFDDIIGQLTDSGEIESFVGSGPRGGRPAMRLRGKIGEVEEAA